MCALSASPFSMLLLLLNRYSWTLYPSSVLLRDFLLPSFVDPFVNTHVTPTTALWGVARDDIGTTPGQPRQIDSAESRRGMLRASRPGLGPCCQHLPPRKFQLRLRTTRLTRSPNDGGMDPEKWPKKKGTHTHKQTQQLESAKTERHDKRNHTV